MMLMTGKDSKADEAQFLLSSSSAVSAPAQSQTNGSKKRAASSDASPTPAPDTSQAKKPRISETAKIGDGQNAKSSKIIIPIDDYCPLPSYRVYVDGDGTIWDASLNQTNAGNNNNKFYKVQVGSVLYQP